MARDPIPTWFFAMVVVRRDDRFVLVHEKKMGRPWSLPAGRVEPGETFAVAAVRETLEEAGILVKLDGILRVEHSPTPTSARMRVVFTATPADDSPLKSIPDAESLKAEWVHVDELDRYTLRGPEIRSMLRYVADGGAVHPLTMLQWEGATYPADVPAPDSPPDGLQPRKPKK
ncbi:MAG: NUDIX hydrolase [Planctomycetia bacterium]